MRQLEVSWDISGACFIGCFRLVGFLSQETSTEGRKCPMKRAFFYGLRCLIPCPLLKVNFPILSGAFFFRSFGSIKVDATAVTQDQPRQWRYHTQPGQA